MAGDILVAKRSAFFTYEGQRVMVKAGRTHVRAGHPILAGREDMFAPVEVDFDLDEPDADESDADEPKPKPRRRTKPKAAADADDAA